MPRPYITIDLAALEHNFDVVAQQVNQQDILAMVKADAYGHGLVQIAKTLAPKVTAFAVARIDEAEALRANHIKTPIVLLSGVCSLQEMQQAVQLQCDIVVHHPLHVQLLKTLTTESLPRIWVKVNSQMNRLGFALDDVSDVLQALKQIGVTKPYAMMMHLPCMNVDSTAAIEQQINKFVMLAKSIGTKISISNTAGIFTQKTLMLQHSTIFRPGRALYGLSPTTKYSAAELGLKPVMSFYASVIAIRAIAAGESVSYERAYVAKEAQTIAVLNVGYGDGYPRTTKGFVVFKKHQLPICGYVSMDMMMVAVPADCDIHIGDEVQLWGSDLAIEDLSQVNGVSTLNNIMPLAPRVKRVYMCK